MVCPGLSGWRALFESMFEVRNPRLPERHPQKIPQEKPTEEPKMSSKGGLQDVFFFKKKLQQLHIPDNSFNL